MTNTPPSPAARARFASWLLPLGLLVVLLGVWEAIVRVNQIPAYQLAPPSLIAKTLVARWQELGPAWGVTLTTMFAALAAAVVTGSVLAALFASSRIVEATLFPYAVMLQVTPLVAIAPFIILWIGYERVQFAQIICAWIVAFFPILSNTVIGLQSADPGHLDLFALYGASRWQTLRWLLAPSALPYFLAGLRVSANLALVGAVVAEFVVGEQMDKPGLASKIFLSQQIADTPLMFAALGLVSLTGVLVYLAANVLSRVLLGKWHATATATEF